jgi:H+/Cl- antiporter ClcA
MIRAKINWDAMGIAASVACAIHCAILPLVLASLPILGVNILNNSSFEYFMIAIAFLIGSGSLWHGYRAHHRLLWPWVLFSAGMLLLLAKQRWHRYEYWILPFAVLFIVASHLINFRACRAHQGGKKQASRPVIGRKRGGAFRVADPNPAK